MKTILCLAVFALTLIACDGGTTSDAGIDADAGAAQDGGSNVIDAGMDARVSD